VAATSGEQSKAFERARSFFRSIPHSGVLGLDLIAFEAQTATARMPYRPELVGNPWNGAIHGGALITLIDQTSGTAVIASLPAPEAVATLDLRIDYLRMAEPGKALLARAECYRITSTIAFVRCHAYYEGDEQPVASSVSSFMRTGQPVTIEEH
jgi:uncharacterized protein (TIGR00369 family)